MEPIYLYKYLEEPGVIVKQIISTYTEGRGYTSHHDDYYSFKDNGQRFYIYKRNIDKVKNLRLYTFNGDINYARAIFMERFKEERAVHFREYKRFNKEQFDNVFKGRENYLS